MRRVEYQRQIGYQGPCTQNFEIGTGYFHEWGYEYKVLRSATVQISVAIVEDENGEILLIEPTNIKFIDTVEIPASDSITAINSKP